MAELTSVQKALKKAGLGFVGSVGEAQNLHTEIRDGAQVVLVWQTGNEKGKVTFEKKINLSQAEILSEDNLIP